MIISFKSEGPCRNFFGLDAFRESPAQLLGDILNRNYANWLNIYEKTLIIICEIKEKQRLLAAGESFFPNDVRQNEVKILRRANNKHQSHASYVTQHAFQLSIVWCVRMPVGTQQNFYKVCHFFLVFAVTNRTIKHEVLSRYLAGVQTIVRSLKLREWVGIVSFWKIFYKL